MYHFIPLRTNWYTPPVPISSVLFKVENKLLIFPVFIPLTFKGINRISLYHIIWQTVSKLTTQLPRPHMHVYYIILFLYFTVVNYVINSMFGFWVVPQNLSQITQRISGFKARYWLAIFASSTGGVELAPRC